MNYNKIINTQTELEETKKIILKNMENAPDGKLRISRNISSHQYYQIVKKGDTSGSYIQHHDTELISALAQKGYEEKLLKEINQQLKSINAFLSHYHPDKLGDIYDSLNETRKLLVDPYFISDEEYTKRWLEEPYIGNTSFPEELQHETNRGEYVRTKSEKTIANIFYEMGIPYKYEAPFTLFNGQTVHPDFTLLNVRNRTEIYHEHLGLLEDEKYRKKNLIKISNYNKSGIILGSNFFITYETEYCPLNDNQIRNTIQTIFQ